ncbi:hypothetical protein BCR44DRAFT_1507022 [Catenaria anguillulae PL171]|uniref:SMP domain-containing protein n=1 Tax=Catenaria anguillulae PL171 TaxID=765915 RepID=A0A1Y2H3X0_9FUNG|nr:hypothetical protein BCR44DRAFT_1507022 [Catenaria anguillulae PL171]
MSPDDTGLNNNNQQANDRDRDRPAYTMKAAAAAAVEVTGRAPNKTPASVITDTESMDMDPQSLVRLTGAPTTFAGAQAITEQPAAALTSAPAPQPTLARAPDARVQP